MQKVPHSSAAELAHGAITRVGLRAAVLPVLVLLAACEREVTVDLAGDAPADREIALVAATLAGLEFAKADGSVERVEFSGGERIDLMTLRSGQQVMRLLTNEQLDEGTYTGVRLLFDTEGAQDEPVVIDVRGQEFDTQIVEGPYAPLNFTIEDEESSNDAFTLMLDLTQSLSRKSNDTFVFTPALRSVRTEDGGNLVGEVLVGCPDGDTFDEGGAVYLFVGENVVPDDRDAAGVEPFAISPVDVAALTGTVSYQLRFLPPGRYTLALTCNADEDDPASDEPLSFGNVRNVEVEERESLQLDID